MALYVELHCDNGFEKCVSGSSEEGPNGTSRAEVERTARKQGWKKTGRRWLCAECAAAPQDGGNDG